MKPPAFAYVAAAGVDEAIALLQSYGGDARVLAGGQSLVPMLNMRLVQPAALIDLNGIAELRVIRVEGSTLRVGALVRYATLVTDPDIARHLPLLREAVRLIGDPQIRNRGTIGGGLAHADASGEIPLVALTLGATVVARGPGGDREIGIDEFLKGAYETDLDPSEIVTEILFPDAVATRSAIVEHVRRHGDFSVIAVAVVGTPRRDGAWEGVRVAVSGAGPRPVLLTGSEALAPGTTLSDDVIEAAARDAQRQAEPASDVRASAEYRRHLVPIYVERALRRLRERRGTAS
ncbi:MAG: FAD binding domain-containing protein [Acidimicrobiales bacterium]